MLGVGSWAIPGRPSPGARASSGEPGREPGRGSFGSAPNDLLPGTAPNLAPPAAAGAPTVVMGGSHAAGGAAHADHPRTAGLRAITCVIVPVQGKARAKYALRVVVNWAPNFTFQSARFPWHSSIFYIKNTHCNTQTNKLLHSENEDFAIVGPPATTGAPRRQVVSSACET